jgi:hypothetical protein
MMFTLSAYSVRAGHGRTVSHPHDVHSGDRTEGPTTMIYIPNITLALTESQANQLYAVLTDDRPLWKRLLWPLRVDGNVVTTLFVALRNHRPPRNAL